MSKKYGVAGNQGTNTTTAKTMLTLIAAATVRPQLFDVMFGADGTPADNSMRFAVQRFTAAGTSAGSPPTPNALDSSDVASLTTTGFNHSAEPTYTAGATPLDIPINQRASFRWVAAPDAEIKAPATAANGLGVTSLSPAYTGSSRCSVQFAE